MCGPKLTSVIVVSTTRQLCINTWQSDMKEWYKYTTKLKLGQLFNSEMTTCKWSCKKCCKTKKFLQQAILTLQIIILLTKHEKLEVTFQINILCLWQQCTIHVVCMSTYKWLHPFKWPPRQPISASYHKTTWQQDRPLVLPMTWQIYHVLQSQTFTQTVATSQWGGQTTNYCVDNSTLEST